ncbi:MAG: hypothetical protein MUE72_10985 [Chitinophagaceae bacterium]|jgi:hypothetical protein|nr:hypothetical protein [Chitinophagaceae bacterium]
MKKIVFSFFFSVITIASFAQAKVDKDKENLFLSCDNFMKTFSQGQFKEAVDMLKLISVIDHDTIDSLAIKSDNIMNDIASSYGKIVSYEYIGSKTIKDFMVKRNYMLRFDKYFLKFSFTLYKSGKGWTVVNFFYNEEIDELFK